MSKKLKMGLLTCALAALSTIAIAQSFTTFPQARIINQLDLQGTVTANGNVGTAGQALVSGGPGVDVTWASVTSPPGGANTQVQYNDGGVFGGDSALTWDEVNDRLTSGFITITGARTNAAAPLLLSSTTTSVRWFETDATADNSSWEWAANGEQFRLGALSDAGALGGTAILVDRTGTTIDTVGFPATASFTNNGANAQFTGNDPRFLISESDGGADAKNWLVRSVSTGFNISTSTDASPFSAVNSAFTIARSGTTVGDFTYTGASIINAGSTGWFVGSAGAPRFTLIETDAAADNQKWRIGTSAETLVWGTRNDADNAGSDFLQIDRTGITVDSITLLGNAFRMSSDGPTLPALPMNGTTAAWNFGGDTSTDGFLSLQRYTGAAVGGPDFAMAHSRGATTSTNTIVANNDEIGSISFMGANGTGFDKGARIMGLVDGTPGASADMPGKLSFMTTPDASASPVERFLIRADGDIDIKTLETTSVIRLGFDDFFGDGALHISLDPADGVHHIADFTSGTAIKLQNTSGNASGTLNNQAIQTPVWTLTGVSALTVTGFVSVGAGHTVKVYNQKTADLTFAHESASSTAANRFTLPGAANLVLNSGEFAEFWYDSATSRWLLFAVRN